MKKAFAIMLSIFTILLSNTVAFALPFSINSQSFVVMEAKSGQVLLSQGADTKKYPASITKILTCGIALQNGDPTDKHTMTYKATHSIDPGSTHIALTEEEIVTVNDLLQATMIESANDAANGLAEYISGDIDNFPELMNQTAQEIGAVNSHFTNAHGLHNKEHYTTAYDMALITRWALGIDGFRDLFGATYYSVPPTNKQPIQRNIGTHHMMLVTSKYYYEGTTGGKLGWTPEAHHTMVTLAERDGLELICVVMDSRTQYEKFKDATKLLDYCFENFTVSEMKLNQYADVPIAVTDEDGEVMAEVTIPEQKFFVVHSPKTAKADIKTKLLAPISYRYNEKIDPQATFVDENGNELLTVELEWDYEKVEPVVQAAVVEKERAHRASFTANWIWGVIAVPLIIYGILLVIRHHNLKLRELRRQQRMNSKESDFDRQINQSINMVNRSSYQSRHNSSHNSGAKSSSIRGREGYRK
ncbi:MAG: D-alanyl-D-alanine carboxypeptidase [Oscillospiraceae bacterium]|nr:D-alanyl-D-alanine carboxypeptidase [Oscillospiraceae bacterium]